jgi:hypothetical protein
MVQERVQNESPGGREARVHPVGYSIEDATRDRKRVFTYDIVIFFVLILLGWMYFAPAVMLQNLVPPQLQGTPIYAVWFGALGGIIISLKGVYDHGPREWQDTYNLWHYGRPISGAIAGGVILLLLKAVGGDDLAWPVALATAFIIGTQERRFFNFLYEVARLLVQVPGDPQDEAISVMEIHPDRGPRGTELRILGRGFDPAATVWVGTSKLERVVVTRDGSSITGIVPAGSGSTRLWVENPSGAARVIATSFEYLDDVKPLNLSFEAQAVGTTSEPKSVERLNLLTAPITITDATLTGPSAADFDIANGDWRGASIEPNASQSIDVLYAPRAVGDSSATLVITTGADTREVPLSGTGVAPSAPAANPAAPANPSGQGEPPARSDGQERQ